MDDDLRSLAAVATRTRKRVNQDAGAAFRFGDGGAVLVADGLGSHYGAEIASALVVEHARRHLEASAKEEAEPDLRRAFEAARQALSQHVASVAVDLPADLVHSVAFGTTLICAVDSPARLSIAYVGNGGLIHLRGNFNDFPASQLLPWSAINYLNPHSISSGGHNVLYKLLSPWIPPANATPTCLDIAKENELHGDILMACSDGIFSYDQTSIGRDPEGHVWISADRAVTAFYDALGQFFAAGVLDSPALERCLQRYLAAVDAEQPLGDDATLGVVISAQAIRYQEARRRRVSQLAARGAVLA